MSTRTPMKLTPLAEAVGALLKSRGETVAVSESSTGGLVSAALLSVPGASAYFVGGGVIYTHKARSVLLRADQAGEVALPVGSGDGDRPLAVGAGLGVAAVAHLLEELDKHNISTMKEIATFCRAYSKDPNRAAAGLGIDRNALMKD